MHSSCDPVTASCPAEYHTAKFYRKSGKSEFVLTTKLLLDINLKKKKKNVLTLEIFLKQYLVTSQAPAIIHCPKGNRFSAI